MNDLRGQFNQFTSTLTEIEIRPAAVEVPGAVTPPSYQTQSNEDGINLQTRNFPLPVGRDINTSCPNQDFDSRRLVFSRRVKTHIQN